jgi:pullulanase/glycogen debranching enzyme
MSAKTGSPYPLSANVTMTGVNSSVFSYHATGGELLLFDTVDAPQASRAIENERTYAPELGHRFDLATCCWPSFESYSDTQKSPSIAYNDAPAGGACPS